MGEIATEIQVSAGGVAYRARGEIIEVVLISVGFQRRWQLPKGMVDRGETTAVAAQREVREEGGVETELVAPLEKIEYWYYLNRGGKRTRIHKFVHFFLFSYLSGDPQYHDQEVHEARWVEINQALEQLHFENEKKVVQKARELLRARA
jgi:8-oxo-dGTP pyrophosphatase MutT (NUDIX family)